MIPNPKTQSDARAVLNSIRRLVRALRLFSRDAESRHDLSAAQIFVLQQLSDKSDISMNELAKRSFTDQSSVSTVVARLVEKKLVHKKASVKDQRVLELRLSAKAVSLLKGQPDAFQTKVVASFLKMSALERKGLKQGLEKLLKGAGWAGEKAEMLLAEKELKK